MNRTMILVLGLILAVWVWGAAGTLSGSDVVAGTVDIALREMSITPNRIDARVGVPIALRITNTSTSEHDLAFASAHMEGLRGAQAILQPGETQTLQLTFQTVGVHQFSCSIHGPAAMSGAVFVAA